MKKILLLTFLFFFLCSFSQKPKKVPYNKAHEFDFWLGKWDVYFYGTERFAGKSHIESIIDSSGILENYSADQINYRGKSLNKYNTEKERWEEYWIDNNGRTLFMAGELKDGKMVLSDDMTGDAKQGINQIIWEKLPNGNIRQTWNLSKDGGKTWVIWFDGEYRKSK